MRSYKLLVNLVDGWYVKAVLLEIDCCEYLQIPISSHIENWRPYPWRLYSCCQIGSGRTVIWRENHGHTFFFDFSLAVPQDGNVVFALLSKRDWPYYNCTQNARAYRTCTFCKLQKVEEMRRAERPHFYHCHACDIAMGFNMQFVRTFQINDFNVKNMTVIWNIVILSTWIVREMSNVVTNRVPPWTHIWKGNNKRHWLWYDRMWRWADYITSGIFPFLTMKRYAF